MNEPIRKIALKDGTVRYRLVVDIGREDGRRRQLTRTFDRRREARAELSRIRHETSKGTYVAPSNETLNQHLDSYLTGATRGRRASTKRNYADALRPARDRFGESLLQRITKADVEGLVEWQLTSGRRRGGKAGTALSGRTVRLTLGRLTAALDMAVAEGKIARNPSSASPPPSAQAAGARDVEPGRGPQIPRRGRRGPAACRVEAVAVWPAPRRSPRPTVG